MQCIYIYVKYTIYNSTTGMHFKQTFGNKMSKSIDLSNRSEEKQSILQFRIYLDRARALFCFFGKNILLTGS